MNYYHIAPLKSNSPILTYQSSKKFQKGVIVEIPIKNKRTLGVVLKDCPKPEFECKEALNSTYYFNHHQIILAEFIAQYYCCSYGEAYGIFTPFDSSISYQRIALKNCSPKALNPDQEKALQSIGSLDSSLLFGDTGSGKTEIYIHLLIQTLLEDKNAIFLMPEISLTPQIEARLKEIFGDMIEIWHSKVSHKKKQETLKKIIQGDIRIIAGARSALFLPLRDLGLIIIDEEHDDAYKSQTKPRYNARDVSLYLGKKCDIKVILGSATPSLKSYHNAKENNTLIRLKGRHFDSKKEFLFEHHSTEITPFLLHHLKACLEKNEQAIVFVPTRANFKTLLCLSCGQSIQCPNCSINMSLHLDKKILSCHYCNYSLSIPSECPNCGDNALNAERIGTAQIAKDISELLPEAHIGIFDKDHTSTQKKLTKILNDFNHHKIDILIGTQMIAKGHDYHNVNLAIILGMDYLLKSPDYRSYEKTIALLHQIAGRSGRKNDGKVIVQSLNESFLRDFSQDYEVFLDYEFSHRSHSYPPYSKLALINFSHKQEVWVEKNMQFILEILEKNKPKEISIIGAGKCAIEKIASKYRYQIFLKSPSHTAMIKALRGISHYSQKMGFEIDIDPIHIL